MNVIRAKIHALQKSFSLILSLISKLKLTLIKYCDKYSDISFLNTLIKNAFNFDLDTLISKNSDSPTSCVKKNLYLKYLFYSLILISWILISWILISWILISWICEGVASAIYWNDDNMTLIVGNWMKGFRLPLLLSITTVTVCGTIATPPFAYFSYQILKGNHSIISFFETIKVIFSRQNEDQGEGHGIKFDQGIIEQVRSEIRPLVLLLRIMIKYEAPILCFIMVTGCFYVQSSEFFSSPTKIFAVTFCTLIFYFVGIQFLYCQTESIFVIVVKARVLILSMRELKHSLISRYQNRSAIEDILISEQDLWSEIGKVLKLQSFIRECNRIFSPVTGIMVAYYYINVTLITYMTISDVIPLPMFVGCCGVVPIFASLLVSSIFFVSWIHTEFISTLEVLKRIKTQTELSYEATFKVDMILRAMENKTTFDPNQFFPKLRNSLIVWVSHVII